MRALGLFRRAWERGCDRFRDFCWGMGRPWVPEQDGLGKGTFKKGWKAP